MPTQSIEQQSVADPGWSNVDPSDPAAQGPTPEPIPPRTYDPGWSNYEPPPPPEPPVGP